MIPDQTSGPAVTGGSQPVGANQLGAIPPPPYGESQPTLEEGLKLLTSSVHSIQQPEGLKLYQTSPPSFLPPTQSEREEELSRRQQTPTLYSRVDSPLFTRPIVKTEVVHAVYPSPSLVSSWGARGVRVHREASSEISPPTALTALAAAATADNDNPTKNDNDVAAAAAAAAALAAKVSAARRAPFGPPLVFDRSYASREGSGSSAFCRTFEASSIFCCGGSLRLMCWCAPRQCHAASIARAMASIAEEELSREP
eukprot:scaffold10469_cov118-Isochrysis_galbana.AAC.5